MPVKLSLRLALLAFSLTAPAQSPWQGEWAQLNPPTAAVGSRLTVFNCTDQSCQFHLAVNNGCSTSFSGDAPRLPLISATEAAITLSGRDTNKSCTLTFHRDPAQITVTSTGNDCAYFCTSTPSFNATLPFQSATIATGLHQNACLLHTSPAAIATCSDPTLSQLEQQWFDLFNDYPLDHPNGPGDSAYSHAQSVDNVILRACDKAPGPADCLRTRFTAEIVTMTARKQADLDASIERGDPATGHALALRIAGRYRHTFANGDVQGDQYRSTDTLILTPVGAASIHFDIALNFYNGHTCSLSGGALFRKDGSFVFDDDPANALPPDPACRLAIIPGMDGISFKDLNGSCKSYCGARGSFDGAAFTFAQRAPIKH